jgi:DNA-binding IclR family transcriptional regulator
MATAKAEIMRIIRATGETSVAFVAAATGLPRATVYGAMWRMRKQNLLVRKGHATYALTRRGARVRDEETAAPLFC